MREVSGRSLFGIEIVFLFVSIRLCFGNVYNGGR